MVSCADMCGKSVRRQATSVMEGLFGKFAQLGVRMVDE